MAQAMQGAKRFGQVSMYELQKLLTHSSPQMTQRYAHLHDDALKKASGVAGALFDSVRPPSQGDKDAVDAEQPASKAISKKNRSE